MFSASTQRAVWQDRDKRQILYLSPVSDSYMLMNVHYNNYWESSVPKRQYSICFIITVAHLCRLLRNCIKFTQHCPGTNCSNCRRQCYWKFFSTQYLQQQIFTGYYMRGNSAFIITKIHLVFSKIIF